MENKEYIVVIDYFQDNEEKQLIRTVYAERPLGCFAKLEQLFALHGIDSNYKVSVTEKK